MVGGDGALSRAELVALSGENPVAETFRQIEQTVRIRYERPVTGAGRTVRGSGAREEFGQAPVKAMPTPRALARDRI